MKGINTPGQALERGGVASYSAPRDRVSHLAFPKLLRIWLSKYISHDFYPKAIPMAPWRKTRESLEVSQRLPSIRGQGV